MTVFGDRLVIDMVIVRRQSHFDIGACGKAGGASNDQDPLPVSNGNCIDPYLPVFQTHLATRILTHVMWQSRLS